MRALFTPYDRSAGMLLYGALGLVAVFTIETVTAVFTLDQSAIDAIYGVGEDARHRRSQPEGNDGPGWYKLFTSATMLVALFFAAALPRASSTASSNAASPGSSAAAPCRAAITSSSSASARSG